jgi:folylpolyglutamate synthase/dihydropteroate synthase
MRRTMKDLESSVTTLKNGTKVANFSSPHIFTFEDGSKLQKCDIREASLFKVNFREKVVKDIRDIAGIEMDFILSKVLLSRMNMWEQLYNDEKVDIVFCSLPLLTAIKKIVDVSELRKMPFRGVRTKDRTKKLILTDRFVI